MRMREALVQSRNLVSVRLLDAIGVDYARQYIAQFGFKMDELPANLSMSLGTASLTPWSIARGYAVMANGGFRVEPYFIERVADRHGATIDVSRAARACRYCKDRLTQESRAGVIVDGFDFSPGGPGAKPQAAAAAAAAAQEQQLQPGQTLAPRAIDERTSYLIKSLMRDVVKRGTATAAKVLNREDIGGKTGSTNEHRDAWFSGFGGDLVTTVWVGKDDFTSLGYREYGGKAALPIWISYMRDALAGVPDVVEPPPAGIVTVAISPSSGNILPEGTPGSLVDYMRQEDYDRLQTSGLIQNAGDETEQSYDIF
jgi:penicillin-binding protein 1A